MGNTYLRDLDTSYKSTEAQITTKDTQAVGSADALRAEHDHMVCKGAASPQSVNENNFSKLSLAAFGEIDINKDGVLEKSELEHSITSNTKLPCESLNATKIMLNNFDVVKTLEGGEKPPTGSYEMSRTHLGITEADLLKFDKIRAGDGFFKGYAKETIEIAATVGGFMGLAPSLFGGFAASTLFEYSTAAVLLGATGTMAASVALGAGIAAGLNYYSYRNTHVPKIHTFFDDINAGANLRSRL